MYLIILGKILPEGKNINSLKLKKYFSQNF